MAVHYWLGTRPLRDSDPLVRTCLSAEGAGHGLPEGCRLGRLTYGTRNGMLDAAGQRERGW